MRAPRFRLLTRHFFRRFFENDLISPGGDAHVGLCHVLAAFITPGLLLVVLVLLKYALVHTTWQRVVELGFDDALLYVALSMIVLGTAATVTWDAFFLEARDHYIIGVLPVGHRLLAAAKLGALGAFLTVFVAAANVLPIVLVPILMLQRADGATFLEHHLPLTIAHAASTCLAGAWAVLAIVALRGVIAIVVPARVFRRVGPIVQGGLILGLLAWFVALPQFLESGRRVFAAGGWERDASPPMWFLGLYETLIGQPDAAFHSLARTAIWAAVVTAAVVVGLAFAVPARRQADLEASSAVTSGRRRLVGAAVRRLADRWVRQPLTRASFVFTLAGLGRSTTHRLYLAAAVGVGLAWSASGFLAVYGRSGVEGFRRPEAATLAMQSIITLCLVVAIRFAITVPLTLPANWLFRLTEGSPVRHYHAGSRAAARAAGLAPVVLLAPVHWHLWGWQAAVYHGFIGVLYATFIVELLFSMQTKFPFAAPYISGSVRLKTRWLPYMIGASVLTGIPASLESTVLQNGRFAVALPVSLAAATALVAAWRRWREDELPGLDFDETGDDVHQRLGLFE